MENKKSGRICARTATLAVMKILIDRQDKGPISITEIVNLLEQDFEIFTRRDTVKAILEDLVHFWPGNGEVKRKDKTKKDGRTYTYSYVYEPTRLDENQTTIRRINEVIYRNKNRLGKETTLSFWFNGYGADKTLQHVGKQYTGVVPLRVCNANGHPYLICFFKGAYRPAHLRIDLMTELETVDREKVEDERRNYAIRVSDKEYLQQHPYMFYEHPGERLRHITFLVKKNPDKPHASLTFLHDVFGDNWHVLSGRETNEQIAVMVNCYPSAASQFVWQYIDCVEVIDPSDVKKEIEDFLKKRYETALFRTKQSK